MVPHWGRVPNSDEKRPCFVYEEVPAFLAKTLDEVPEDSCLVLWLFVSVFSVIPRADVEPWDEALEFNESDEELVFAVEMARDALIHPTWYDPAADYKCEIEPSEEAVAKAAKKRERTAERDGENAKKKRKKEVKDGGKAPAGGKKAGKLKGLAPGALRASALEKVKQFLQSNVELQHPLVVQYRRVQAEKAKKKLQARAERRGVTVEELLRLDAEEATKALEQKRRDEEAKAEAKRLKEALQKETPRDRLIRLENNVAALLETKEFDHCLKTLNKLMDMEVTPELLNSCEAQVRRLSELRHYSGHLGVQTLAKNLRTKWRGIFKDGG